MSNTYFKFKQFTIWHDKCAMKVGTDGVLLGAWAPVKNSRQILDVGTGTGLISLLLAQRNAKAHITSIEIDTLAAEQAKENAKQSPWSDRINIICCNFDDYQSDIQFDLIVSNPPYFMDALKCPDTQRSLARHTGELNYELLFSHSAHLLSESGIISIIIPSETEDSAISIAWRCKLHLQQRLRVFTKPGKPCRRVMLTFGFQELECKEESLCIEGEGRHQFTAEYIALTKDFYLKM